MTIKLQSHQNDTLRESKSRNLNSVPVTITFKDWVYNIFLSLQINIWWWGCYYLHKIYLVYFSMINNTKVAIRYSFFVNHIFTSVAYTSDDVKDYDSVTSYNSDAIQCILNNSANAHIWAILADFVPSTLKRFLPNPEAGVLTIGGANQFPYLIGDIKVSWIDSTSTLVHYILKDALYFPSSPVNIICITTFADQLKDDKGISITTKRRDSILTWDLGRHSIELTHSTTRLPTMRVNQSFSSFTVSISLCLSLSPCLSLSVSVCVCVSLSLGVCVSRCVSIYLCVCLSI